MQNFTIKDFNEAFPTDDAALDYIRDLLYPDGIKCRKCEKVQPHHKLNGRKAYSCAACGTHMYPLAGTIFEKSRTPLKSWLYAIYLMASTRCGISAKQLERELGVTYKTAWRMFKQIRLLFDEDDFELKGIVEVDEAYIGGKQRHIGRGRPGPKSNKTPVFGMVERGGRAVAEVVENTTAGELLPLIEMHVLPDALINSDEWTAYKKLPKMGYRHATVPHGQKVYVVGSTHTNTVEGLWSLIKGGISGVYRTVSRQHLQQYLDEYTYRYNHRHDEQPMFESMAGRISSVRLGKRGQYNPIR